MKLASINYGLIVFLLLSVLTQATLSYLTGPSMLTLGSDAVFTVSTTDEANISYGLFNSVNVSVASGSLLVNGSGSVTFNASLVSSVGEWTVVVSDNESSFMLTFTVVEPVQFNIILLESENHGAQRVVAVQTPNTWNAGASFMLKDRNVTKSGLIRYGLLNELDLNCDVNGDGVLNKTMYVWVGDSEEAGVYNTVFMDDDAQLNESAETGVAPKTFLSEGDTSMKCAAYADLAPYIIEHVYSSGLTVVLHPGPGDLPYSPQSRIVGVVSAYNMSGDLVSANITSFVVRYTNTSSGLTSEKDVNALLSSVNQSRINGTGGNGLSPLFDFNASAFMALLPDSGPGEYVFIINGYSTETYRIVPDWTATVIIGDPLTKTDKYDFRTGDSVAVGVETNALSINLSIEVKVLDPDDNLIARWSYIGVNNANGIYYDNNSKIYVAGVNSSTLTPYLTVHDEGEWRVEVTVASGNDERFFERPFMVKSYELTVFSIIMHEGPGPSGEPEFNVMEPGGKAFVGVFATTFGVRGDFRKNIEEAEVRVVDANTFDGVNECNASLVSLRITDEGGNLVTDYPGSMGLVSRVDNVYKIMEDYGPGGETVPLQFHGQCMAYLAAGPAATGYYTIDATLTVGSGNQTKNISGGVVVEVHDVETGAEPWDLTSNHHRWHFNIGDNVTFKMKARNLYTGEDIPSSDFMSINLIEVFNPDYGGPVTDLIESYGFIRNLVLGGENTTVLWIKLGNTSGFHHIEYEATVTLNVNGTLRNTTARGFTGVETRLYDIKGHPNFERTTEYFRPDEDIDFIVEVWSSSGPASGVSVFIDRVVLTTEREVEVNFTSARATTDSGGRANVTIRPTSGLWATGGYDVRIRVKDTQGNIDYGWGWFDVKTFQVLILPVELEGNGTICAVRELGGERAGKEDEMEKGGPSQITGDQLFAVLGVNRSGTFVVTPLLNKSFLFQITNLNGEPVFRDIRPEASSILSCNLSVEGLTTQAKYFTLYTEDLGGMYEFEVVAKDSSDRLGTGYTEFFVMPFELYVYLINRGEPVFSKGDVLTFKAETQRDYNITGVSVKRLVRVGGAEEIISGASQAMSSTLVWLDGASSERRFTLTIPSNLSGIRKGEYVIQLEFTVTDDEGNNRTLVYNQWVMIKSFTYSLANMLRSWTDSFNTTESWNFGFGCTADGWDGERCVNESRERGEYSFNYESCPYPVINASERCAFVNASDVRRRVLELWGDCPECIERFNEFVSYYNRSGNLTVFRGFNIIVGPISFERASSAKAYLALDASQLTNDSLIPLSAGDVIVDASGIAFRISEIKQWEIRLNSVSFVRRWNVQSLKFNNTGKTLSGAIKIGVIREGEVRIDFNGDGNISDGDEFGMPYVLYDPTTSGVYDTAKVDSDLDLNLDEEQEMRIGAGGILITIGNKTRNMYLIKADNFDVIFAFNESGRDNWMGTHRKSTNITIPVYSKTRGLKLSVQHIFDDRKRTLVTSYTAYNTTIGEDGMGLLVVSVPSSGYYTVQYRISDANETQFEVPEPWDAPHLQVRSFDTERDIFREVNTIPSFVRLPGNASRMMWWESRGFQKEWFNTNGSLLEGLFTALPTNFSGYYGDIWPYITHGNGRLHVLYDKAAGLLYVRNTTNFTGAVGAQTGQVAYTITQRYPNKDDSRDSIRNITFTFAGKRCWDSGCQIVLGENQPISTLQEETTPSGGSRPCFDVSGYGELCGFGFEIPRLWMTPLWINKTDSNTTVVYILTNINTSDREGDSATVLGRWLNRSRAAVSINSAGQPNTTAVFTISADVNEEDWCTHSALGCIGGDYKANIRILNATWRQEEGSHWLHYEISEAYNNSDIWATTSVESNVILVGPSSNYYVRYVDWKGVWMALDLSNASDLKLYLSQDANFSGEPAYREGENMPLYDKWFNDTVNFRLLSLTPKNYGSMLINANQNYSFDGTTMWITDINTTTNRTRFYATDCQDCDPGNGNEVNAGDETEMSSLRFRLNAVVNASTVNATIWTPSATARWGYDTSGLSAGLNASFYNWVYQKMVGRIRLDGAAFNVVVLDSNASESETDFTQVFLSNDTSLETSELRVLGNTTPFAGTHFYLSSIDGDRVVILDDSIRIVGVPYSDDGLGYYISVAQPANFKAGPFRKTAPEREGSQLSNNTGRNYTFIMYAEDRGDEQSELGRIMVDDDNRWIEERECDGDSCTCYDNKAKSLNESGRIAEEYGYIGRWSNLNFLILNDSSGKYQRTWFDVWDRNKSEPIRLIKRFDGWWGEYLTNSSNITMGLRVVDFLGKPIAGTVTVKDIIMMGEFADEWEHPLSEFNNINYSVSYDGASAGNNSLDSDGVIFITIHLTDNTTWWEDFGYQINLNITSASGETEETDMWFDLGRKEEGKGGGERAEDACRSALNETVCASKTGGRCEWKPDKDDCVSKTEPVDCSLWDGNQTACTVPCVWIPTQSKCIACSWVEEQDDCNRIKENLGYCSWVTEEGESECMFTGEEKK